MAVVERAEVVTGEQPGGRVPVPSGAPASSNKRSVSRTANCMCVEPTLSAADPKFTN